ncbi:transcriptional coactivator HFI1/ADA1 [Cryptococcus gattii Ru294]|nr:transcriptional coactivator HFI1/ADA1 [Cryptococcus gattii Ru294]
MSSVTSPHHPPSRSVLQPTSTNTLHSHTPVASSSTHMYQNHTLLGPNGIGSSLMRIDIHAIKQELHDVLGEAGLPYWKSLNAYLVGQLGRGELEEMVRGWLKKDHLHLHNKLLSSLLTNASISTHDGTSSSLQQRHKRQRPSVNDPDFDVNDTLIESKRRVEGWVMNLGKKERARVKKALAGAAEKGAMGVATAAAAAAEKDMWGGIGEKRWSPYTSNSLIPPLALPTRHLPSSHQLSLRLSQFAKLHDLSIPSTSSSTGASAADDIGEFMAVGMDAHMGDILHGIVHLTGRDRPGETTIRVPLGKRAREDMQQPDNDQNQNQNQNPSTSISTSRGNIPPPDLETFHHLFTLHPNLHPNISPAIHRLMTAHTLAELEAANPYPNPNLHANVNGNANGNIPKAVLMPSTSEVAADGKSTSTSMSASAKVGSVPTIPTQPSQPQLHPKTSTAPGPASIPGRQQQQQQQQKPRSEIIASQLLANGLLKLDKAGGHAGRDGKDGGKDGGRDGEDGKKERKHNLHWKYEDPALLLRDVLG